LRFWLIDLPALAIDLFFKVYFAFLAIITILCFSAVLYSLMALALDWPRVW
jgi:hypothetical protein